MNQSTYKGFNTMQNVYSKLKYICLLSIPVFVSAAPVAPSNLELKALSETSVFIQWQDNSLNETGFKIFRDEKLIQIMGSDITSFIDNDLQSNRQYQYTIKATDDVLAHMPNQYVIDSLAYMGNEERLAYDIYTNLNSAYANSIKQFTNITDSEKRHVGIVQELVRKYNIDITTVQDVQNPVADKNISFDEMPMGRYDIKQIQELYDFLYQKGIKSKQAALEVGCMVEVVDVNDLDRYIEEARNDNDDDIISAFEELRSGSYSHYWAFDKGLKNMGVSEGCGILGNDYIKDYPTR